jgi:hypothetical protein
LLRRIAAGASSAHSSSCILVVAASTFWLWREGVTPRLGTPHTSIQFQGQRTGDLLTATTSFRRADHSPLRSYSTSFLAKALPSHGQIDTIEFSPVHAKVSQQNFLDTDLVPFPTVHVGAALDVLRDPSGAFASPPGTEQGLPLEKRGYDLVFIDADKENYFEYWIEALRLTRKGGVIILDNAVRGGR